MGFRLFTSVFSTAAVHFSEQYTTIPQFLSCPIMVSFNIVRISLSSAQLAKVDSASAMCSLQPDPLDSLKSHFQVVGSEPILLGGAGETRKGLGDGQRKREWQRQERGGVVYICLWSHPALASDLPTTCLKFFISIQTKDC